MQQRQEMSGDGTVLYCLLTIICVGATLSGTVVEITFAFTPDLVRCPKRLVIFLFVRRHSLTVLL